MIEAAKEMYSPEYGTQNEYIPILKVAFARGVQWTKQWIKDNSARQSG